MNTLKHLLFMNTITRLLQHKTIEIRVDFYEQNSQILNPQSRLNDTCMLL